MLGKKDRREGEEEEPFGHHGDPIREVGEQTRRTSRHQRKAQRVGNTTEAEQLRKEERGRKGRRRSYEQRVEGSGEYRGE